MPVIGIDQVPRNLQRPSFLSDVGYAQGSLARAVLSALLGQAGARGVGQVPTTPTASNPGTFNFPPGSQSPLEAAQIQQLGGVPTRQGFLSKATQNPAPFGTTGPSFTPDTRFGIRPDLSYLQRQADLQKTQRDLDPNSPENLYKKAQAGYYDAYRKLVEQGLSDTEKGGNGGGRGGSGLTPDQENRLLQSALNGDAESETIARQLGLF